MLEFPALVLSRWQLGATSVFTRHCWHRHISDGGSGEAAGVALWQPATAFGWLRFFWPPVLAVYESDDVPLLFTAHRSLLPVARWDVRDADLRTVGSLRGRWLLGTHNSLIGGVVRMPNGLVRYQSASEEELGVLRGDGERHLQFADALAGEPFMRMLILAAALLER